MEISTNIKTILIPGSLQKPEFEMEKIELTPELQRLNDGNFFWPKATDELPGIGANFVSSRDGFVSRNEEGMKHAGFISEGNLGDRFIMGLARTLVSETVNGVRGAIMNGANTLNVEHDVDLTASGVFPNAVPYYNEYLKKTGSPLRSAPIFFVTGSGELVLTAKVFEETSGIETYVVTTESGKRVLEERIKALPTGYRPPKILTFGDKRHVDMREVFKYLRQKLKITRLLTEGGARFFAGLHEAKLIQLDLQTIAPLLLGNDRRRGENARVSLADGIAFGPQNSPHFGLFSAKVDNSGFLYLQYARRS